VDAAAFDLLPVPVAWCDAQGRWIGCNRAFAGLTGWQADGQHAALPGDVMGPAGHGQALATLLQAGADVDHLPCGRRAGG
jgi:PAS domain-containing protein